MPLRTFSKNILLSKLKNWGSYKKNLKCKTIEQKNNIFLSDKTTCYGLISGSKINGETISVHLFIKLKLIFN